ncbi:MAG TPA: SDR family NAD(P)-dependent oxidoreductase [Acidimicrobiales bacterium]|nr:SDR family NAD(P)-dependent oxidoreductase [Acidimicrobiales bacterium]
MNAGTDVRDKVIVVAGGATGIGAAAARQLVGAGAKVVLGDINEEGGRATAAAIGGETPFVTFDIADEDSVARLMDTAVSSYGRLDGLFSNAADLRDETLSRDTDIVEMDVATWHHSLDVDLTGFFYTARHAIPHLLAAGGGPIVVTSSAAAFMSDRVRPAYSTAKAGLGALVRHIASRWGKEGIRCNAVAPGVVLSEVQRANVPERHLESYLKMHRLDRLGAPDDIASAVTFLLSDQAEWITGQVIGVDGGMVMR